MSSAQTMSENSAKAEADILSDSSGISPERFRGEDLPSLSEEETGTSDSETMNKEGCLVGRLPNGNCFPVPETEKPFTVAGVWTSPFMQIVVLVLAYVASTYFYFFLTGRISGEFLIVQFVFWRLAYNVGIGAILNVQSNSGGFVRLYKKRISGTWWERMLERSVRLKSGKRYSAKEFPVEFNAWQFYRWIAMLILAADVGAYFAVVLAYWQKPDFSDPVQIIKYVVGFALGFFGLWSKADAHRVIGDYAWYWGDFFFLVDAKLVFDGIFQMFPHPMYTVGYAFMYGAPLVTQSFTVLYVSLFGHMCQLLFLTFVENPHIDKTYNSVSEPSEAEVVRDSILYGDAGGYLKRNELVVFKNFDPFRSSDIVLVILVLYTVLVGYMGSLHWCLMQHVLWRFFHTIFLGWLLRQQSLTKFLTRKFASDKEAFHSWKQLYNFSVTMVNFSFVVAAVKAFQWESWLSDSYQARVALITCGVILVLLNFYVSLGVYEEIGDFGYFYGDFFIDDVPSKLTYSGIYRYVNNPDTTLGFAGYYGMVLVTGNLWMFPIALCSHLMAKVFERFVEKPHIRNKYGKDVRQDGGLASALRQKANKLKDTMKAKKTDYEATVKAMKRELQEKNALYDKLINILRRDRKKKVGKKTAHDKDE